MIQMTMKLGKSTIFHLLLSLMTMEILSVIMENLRYFTYIHFYTYLILHTRNSFKIYFGTVGNEKI